MPPRPEDARFHWRGYDVVATMPKGHEIVFRRDGTLKECPNGHYGLLTRLVPYVRQFVAATDHG